MTDYDKMWDEINALVEEKVFPPKQEYEKSIGELSSMWGCSEKSAIRIVSDLLERGLLIQRTARGKNGKPCIVYSPVE